MAIWRCRHQFKLVAAAVLALAPFVGLTFPTQVVAVGSPAPQYLYTSSNFGHWSYKIDPTTASIAAEIGDLSTNTGWRCGSDTNIANRAGTKIYQSRPCDNKVTIIDVATNAVSDFAWGNGGNTTMAVSPDDQYIYFAYPYAVTKVRTADGTSAGGASRDDNNGVLASAVSNDGTKVVIPNAQRGKVQIYDSSLTWVGTIGASMTVNETGTMAGVKWAVANPVANEVWFGWGSNFYVIDVATNALIHTYAQSFGTVSAIPSFSADGTKLYAISGNSISEINTSNGTVAQTYPVAGISGGTHAALSPNGDVIYVANGQTLSWLKLDDSSTGTLTLPTKPNNDYPRTLAWVQPLSAPSVSLSAASGSATTGSAVSGLYTVTNSGGNATYTISPSLPAGLSFSATTGLISGTATATQSATTHTITATNVAGTSTAAFSLTVSEPAPTPSPTPSPTETQSTTATPTPTPTATKSTKTSTANSQPTIDLTPFETNETDAVVAQHSPTPQATNVDISATTQVNESGSWTQGIYGYGLISLGVLAGLGGLAAANVISSGASNSAIKKLFNRFR